jgi:hypothetical protein
MLEYRLARKVKSDAEWNQIDTITGRFSLEHDPEKWEPVFRKDHAQIKR